MASSLARRARRELACAPLCDRPACAGPEKGADCEGYVEALLAMAGRTRGRTAEVSEPGVARFASLRPTVKPSSEMTTELPAKR